MKKYMTALLKCFLMCLFVLAPSSVADAAIQYKQNYIVPYTDGAAYVGYEYVPELAAGASVKKVKWSVGDSKKVTVTPYSSDSLYATVVFKGTGSVKVYRSVSLKGGKVVKTTYNFQIYKKSAWFKYGGYTYYYLKSGGYATDQWIGERYVDANGHWDARFEKVSAGVRYLKKDGTYAKKEWIQADDGNEYYFDAKGLMVKNKWVEGCYLQKDGKKKQGLTKTGNGWKMAYDSWDGETEFVKNSWDTINGKKVYFNSKGELVKSQWKKIDGKTYYFDKNGYLVKNKWVDGYYVNEEGYRVKSQRAGDYYIDSKGRMATGRWIGGYYVDGTGKILKNQWVNGIYVGLNGKRVKGMHYTSGTTAINGVCLTATERQLKRLVSVAKKEVGKPYIWGGNGPDGYDCSGFVSYCYRAIGITLPRTTYYMYNSGVSIDPNDVSEWQVGDLLINQGTIDGRGGGHVIMYIGNGRVIQSTSGGVQIGSAYNYVGRYARVRRILYVK
ncbi:MAG: NlpC/P60 family protein [Eubacteriales bacterium]|nr:NlpC/P60 family protein [Eubacteriales bacterium]